jgi:hypothetical protein
MMYDSYVSWNYIHRTKIIKMIDDKTVDGVMFICLPTIIRIIHNI